jgi:hypothetical protein
MKKSIVLNPGMGSAVVNHLRQFADLPPDGILAGQAVDSAITDLFGSGGGVYNDIDVFRQETEPFKNRNMRTANSLTSRFELSTSVGDDAYGTMNVLLEVVQTYGIHAVKREGMLNTVSCNVTWPVQTLSAQRVIRGFDINCTRVAVDLATNELIWDRDYQDFLHSRQLRISMMHTPWHTFLRLAKKAEELPSVYVDFDVAAESCVAIARSTWLDQMLRRKGVSLQFGQKHQELAARLESVWAPYFSYEKKRIYQTRHHKWTEDEALAVPGGKAIDLCSLTPRGGLETKLQERCNRMGSGLLFFAPRVIESSRRKVAPAAYHKLNAIVALDQQAPAQPVDLDAAPLRRIGRASQRRDFVQVNAELFGTDYVQGQALPAIAAKVSEWVGQHAGLSRGMVGLTLEAQYARMQAVTEVCRKFGKQYFNGDTKAGFGVLENERDAAVFESPEAMEAALMRYYRANSTPFDVKPLPLPPFVPARFEGFHVRELLTPHELRNEGNTMGHCVGGYSDAVRRNTSRILTIRYLDERRTQNCSTVEVRGEFDAVAPALKVIQNYSVSNTQPSEENKAFLAYLVAYMASADKLAACYGMTAQQARKQLTGQARTLEAQAKRQDRVRYHLRKTLDRLTQGKLPTTASFPVSRQLMEKEREIRQLRETAVLLREFAEVGKSFPAAPAQRPSPAEVNRAADAKAFRPVEQELEF